MMMRERISLTEESGQTMAEYAFVLSVITAIVIASLALLSDATAKGIEFTVSLVKSVT